MICDDQAPYRFYLRSLLEQERDLEIVGEGWHGGQAIERCRDLQPDVLVIDLDMPVMSGYTALQRVRRVAPTTRICVLTGNDVDLVAEASSSLGADRVFAKSTPPDEIVTALRRLASAPLAAH
ncbi:MAG: response regulator transcription factor [Thermoleophilia bacterium]|nr:response regulator transcription factor [Thermoleophilia bacterium]